MINTPLLYSFSDDDIRRLIDEKKIVVTQYKKGETIHFTDEKCIKLEVILKGRIIVERIKEDGSHLTVSSFQEGDILGGNIIFSSRPFYLMNVKCHSDVELLEIEKNNLLSLIMDNSDFLVAYLEFISDTTTILGNKIKHYMNSSLREKILDYLTSNYDTHNSTTIELETSKKDIASIIGCQRTSLSRELSKMENEGLIKVNRNKITIKKAYNQ